LFSSNSVIVIVFKLHRRYRSLTFIKTSLNDRPGQPSATLSARRLAKSTTDPLDKTQTVDDMDQANSQQPAEVDQWIGDFAVTRSRYEWVRMDVVEGTTSFASVWKFDSRATCLIRYEAANGEVIEHQLLPYEVMEISAAT
jgi:hypothetical protein